MGPVQNRRRTVRTRHPCNPMPEMFRSPSQSSSGRTDSRTEVRQPGSSDNPEGDRLDMTLQLAEKKKITVDDLQYIPLKDGAHRSRKDGVCAMEAAAWLAGREHTDSPQCVSPVIASFIRYWNDTLPSDEDRNRLLKPLLPIILETKTSSKAESKRAWLAIDWLARTCTPAFFDLIPSLSPHAEALRKLEPFTEKTAEKK